MGKLAQAAAKAVEEKAVQGCAVARLSAVLNKNDSAELADLLAKTGNDVPRHLRLSYATVADIIVDVYPDSGIVESSVAGHRQRKCSCPRATS
jgi:hypothetical protein